MRLRCHLCLQAPFEANGCCHLLQSNRSHRFCISNQSVYMASELSLLMQARSKPICGSKERKFSIWNEKQYLESLIKNILLKVLNPKCICSRHSTLHAKLHLYLPPNMQLPVGNFTTASPACVCGLLSDVSTSTFFIVGKASFLHKFWPHWTASYMQRLLDIPWLTDHSPTAWMCGLACSEGAHHCQPWAGESLMGGASRRVLESYWLLQFSPPGDLWSGS